MFIMLFLNTNVFNFVYRSCIYPCIDMKEESSTLVLGLLMRYQLRTICFLKRKKIKLVDVFFFLEVVLNVCSSYRKENFR